LPTEALGLHGFVTYSTKDIQKKGCSRGDYDSESNGLGNQGLVFSNTDEKGAELQQLRIKHR